MRFVHHTIVASASIVMLAINSVGSAAVITANPELPPDTGVYRFEGPITFQGPDFQIVLEDAVYEPLFDPPPVRTAIGDDEEGLFDASMTGTAVLTIPAFGLDGVAAPFELTGPSRTLTYDKVGNPTGTFAAEMLWMQLIGEAHVPGGLDFDFVLRESPDIQSAGQTTITDFGSGLYHIDSFFDVFTELSVDGGYSWIASVDRTRMTLAPIPEPSSFVMFAGLFGMGLLGYCRRRRKAA